MYFIHPENLESVVSAYHAVPGEHVNVADYSFAAKECVVRYNLPYSVGGGNLESNKRMLCLTEEKQKALRELKEKEAAEKEAAEKVAAAKKEAAIEKPNSNIVVKAQRTAENEASNRKRPRATTQPIDEASSCKKSKSSDVPAKDKCVSTPNLTASTRSDPIHPTNTDTGATHPSNPFSECNTPSLSKVRFNLNSRDNSWDESRTQPPSSRDEGRMPPPSSDQRRNYGDNSWDESRYHRDESRMHSDNRRYYGDNSWDESRTQPPSSRDEGRMPPPSSDQRRNYGDNSWDESRYHRDESRMHSDNRRYYGDNSWDERRMLPPQSDERQSSGRIRRRANLRDAESRMRQNYGDYSYPAERQNYGDNSYQIMNPMMNSMMNPMMLPMNQSMFHYLASCNMPPPSQTPSIVINTGAGHVGNTMGSTENFHHRRMPYRTENTMGKRGPQDFYGPARRG
jgi:hypothetical protein